MDVKTMTETERHAYYRSEIARAQALGLKDLQGSGRTFEKDGTAKIAGSGMIQSAETARHIYQQSERDAIANALTPEEKIIANSHGRQVAYHKASLQGVRADENVVHRAGVLAVQEAAVAKVKAAKADQK